VLTAHTHHEAGIGVAGIELEEDSGHWLGVSQRLPSNEMGSALIDLRPELGPPISSRPPNISYLRRPSVPHSVSQLAVSEVVDQTHCRLSNIVGPRCATGN
jgi:hypothetical protein